MSLINGVNGKKAFQRLPKDVVPVLYKISLKPDLVKFVFAGSESIHVKVTNQTKEIVLNARDIDIIEATFKQHGGEAIKGLVSIDQETDKAFIRFNQELKIGDGQLNLIFNGVLNDKMVGFYRCRYKCSATGEERISGTTQFEPTDARRAFPCWDEPEIKAKFEVTIIAPKDRVVLSNTNVTKETDHSEDANLKIVQFEPTPIMSTYLLAWVVGEYESVSSKTSRDVKVKVYTPIGKKNQGSFALDDAVKYIEYFEDYFKVPYPLEKLDHISIPDFAFNAMENWGLVTYRESCLLVDPENTSFSAKQNTSRVIAHETAHQWFGNLVTMEWWTHLWLNEGFATFMQYLAVEAHHPEFDFWKQFCVESSIEALDIDASHRSHAIEIPVNAPDEISSIFDHISYHKGASVIRMCHSWIGDEAFRNGMKDYLTDHAYKNATTKDLWRALEKSSKKPVEKMMSTWTGLMGYPLINVEMTSQGTKLVLKLTQEKFSIDAKLTESEEKMLWMIPIAVVTSDNPKQPKQFDLLTGKTVEITLDSLSSGGWIKLNPSMFGFYRVNYPIQMWKQLAEGIKNKTLSPLDRLQIIDDLLALNLAGKVHVSIVLDVLEAYANEDDYVPWDGVDRCLARLGSLLSYTDLQSGFQQFARKLVSNVYEKIGLERQPDEPNTRSLMRSLLLSRLISLKDDGALAEAKKKFELHCNSQQLNPDLRSAVYKAIASTGDDSSYESLYKLYHDAELQEEKLRIATALGSTGDDRKIERALKFAFSEHVRSQNAWQVIIAVSVTPKGRDSAWKFYKDNIKEVKERYGSHRSSSVLIQKLTENFASEEMAKEVSEFFSQNPFPGLEDVVYRAVERIRVNAQWLKREVSPLKEYLAAKNG